MPYISAVLFALSANMDNVAIGVAYGVKGVRIRFGNNLLIALLTSMGTLISMAAGGWLAGILPGWITKWLGSAILIAMGLWFVFTSLHKRFLADSERSQNASSAEVCEEWAEELFHAKEEKQQELTTGYVSTRESFILALALMINNLGFGVGARITGLPIFATSGCTFIISVLLLSLGICLGRHFRGTFFGRYTDLLSGCIIILLGVYELFR